MTCESFLEGFTDYRDGIAPASVRQEAEAHLQGCPDCRRYEAVVERGLEVLRSQRPLTLPEDFRPRLRHRLFHVDDEAALVRHASSGATALSVLGVAVVLSAVAWSPLLNPGSPTVELSPIVVSRPPAPLRLRPASLALDEIPLGGGGSEADLWDDAHALLFQYSPLSQRYRQRALLRRAGLNEDH